MSSTIRRTLLPVAALACLIGIASAQTTTTKSETRKFEIIAVDGNQLVVRGPDGTREITVPADFRFTVDGKPLTVQQLKPGMAGTATISTTTTVTPVTVTEVKNGTVMQASGNSIIVRTDEGFKAFTQGDIDKRGIKIMRAGKPAGVSDFRAGDKLSAVIITSMPPKVVTEQEVNATLAASGGAAGGAAAASRSGAPSSAATTAGAGAAGSAARGTTGSGGTASGKRSLPKTAGPLPVMGLLGALSLLAAGGLTMRRRRLNRG
jgi:hypothetical protein